LLLKADKLSLTLGERLLFDGLSFAIGPGEVWAITGPSGAGKSSLLRLLTGELAPSAGTVERPGLQGEIPQGLALNDELSAGDNARVGMFRGLSFFNSLRLLYQREPGPDRQLARWGVKNAEQRVGTLSGGEKQRVAVARALLERWQVLLADEPISQLDDENARKVLLELKAEAVRRCGALVLVLHHRSLADEVATHKLKLGNQ
jgi:phosphonate transport system ATP-binding protein